MVRNIGLENSFYPLNQSAALEILIPMMLSAFPHSNMYMYLLLAAHFADLFSYWVFLT